MSSAMTNYELCPFSNLSATSPTSQLILQPFRRFTYVTAHSPMSRAHSPTFPSLHLRHSSFSNPSVALPTSQLILQPFRCFTYITTHSQTLLSLLLRHRLFTYVTWRAARGKLSFRVLLCVCNFTTKLLAVIELINSICRNTFGIREGCRTLFRVSFCFIHQLIM